MFRVYLRFRYSITNAIALLVLSVILELCSIGFLVIDGVSFVYFLYTCLVSVVFFFALFYMVCAFKDNHIQRYGVPTKATVVKIYNIKYRFSPNNKVILYEYINSKGKLIRTSENINKYSHNFKLNEKINVIYNGKKCIVDKNAYK